jgi:prevent-host-death family protein
MAEVGAYEAKTHLPSLLRRVEAGERITITRHGHPIAELVPVGASAPGAIRQALDDLRTFGDGRTLGPELSIRKLIDEGRAR